MSLAALLAKTQQVVEMTKANAAKAEKAVEFNEAVQANPIITTSVVASGPVAKLEVQPAHSVEPMASEDTKLVSQFRKTMDHLSAALKDPSYAIPVADAVRDIGLTIREHPHLNTLIEPQDFANLVRVITESAHYKARNAAATRDKRETKATAKSELEKAFASTFSLDGLADVNFDDAMPAPPKKKAIIAENAAPPEKNAGINLAQLLARAKKG